LVAFLQDGDVSAPDLTPLKLEWADSQDGEGENQRRGDAVKIKLAY